jgi:hypothetical protein
MAKYTTKEAVMSLLTRSSVPVCPSRAKWPVLGVLVRILFPVVDLLHERLGLLLVYE